MREQTIPHSPIPPDTRAVELAQRLALRRDTVEIQGTVIHRSTARTLAVALAAAAALTLLAPIWPLAGALALLLVGASLLADLDGGQGLTRRLLAVRDIGHNVLLWRATRLPVPADPTIFQHHPPSPPRTPLSDTPQLLLCAPADDADIHHTRLYRALLGCGLGGILLGAVALIVPSLRAASVPGWAAAALAATSAAAFLLHTLRPAPQLPSPALPHIEALAEALRNTPLPNLTVSIAFIEGLFAHGDGIEVLLQNYRTVLPPEHTRVLILAPAEGALAAQTRTGLFGRLHSDPLLVAAAGGQVAPGRSMPAARALRIGWRAATLQGDLSQTDRLMTMLTQLDAAATEKQW